MKNFLKRFINLIKVIKFLLNDCYNYPLDIEIHKYDKNKRKIVYSLGFACHYKEMNLRGSLPKVSICKEYWDLSTATPDYNCQPTLEYAEMIWQIPENEKLF